MATNNSSNYSPAEYAVQVGSANGTLANISPSTAGIALVSAGASSNPTFSTVAIAGGGTNATSYTQTNGIVTYNGTSLVNYAGPQIDSTGRYTNTTQPAFYAYLNASDNNVTGDGTLYTFGATAGNSLVELYDVGNNFNTSTATFTAPVTGYYLINAQAKLMGVTSAHTSGVMLLTMSSYIYRTNTMNPFAVYNASQGILAFTISYVAKMTAGDTLQFQINVFNGTKVVDILAATNDSFISARLIS